jgi:hypothetical protein
MTTTDHRKAAEDRILVLVSILQSQPATEPRDSLITECTALAVAIRAFHMEGIRFRMFNVDRVLSRGVIPLPPEASTVFSEARAHLEAAGFQTRSHQAPGS